MDGEERRFASPKEEAEYWKGLALQYKQSYEDAKEELDEFQISSRELEAELEAQLEQQESKNKDLSGNNQRLQLEVDTLREKLEGEQATFHRQLTELGDELAQVRAIKEELAKYIRELEQTNDDLERTKRATVVSLEDFESRLNMAIERNAFLESELEERESLAITVQRLKDEARDLRQELSVKKRDVESDSDSVHSPREKEAKLAGSQDGVGAGEKVDSLVQTDHIDSNRLVEELIQHQTPQSHKLSSSLGTPVTSHPSSVGGGTPLTPSARISALNIVGDLLRKVGALESKLASCRNVVNNQTRNPKSGATSPLNSPSYGDAAVASGYAPRYSLYRAKRLHRSAGSSTVSSAANSSSASSTGAPPQGQPGVKVTV